eukprot:932344-Prorocentrum_minimum.AAC.1
MALIEPLYPWRSRLTPEILGRWVSGAIVKAEAEAKAAALEREAASLAKEIAALEFKVGRGEFDRKTTK